MNRKERRTAGTVTLRGKQAQIIHDNVYHWGEIKRIKRAYDALTDEQKAEQKAPLAAEIDAHIAALLAA